MSISTLDTRGRTAASVCRENGWVVGTRLIGNEGYGPTVIEITALGEGTMLAKRISHNGVPVTARENSWALWCRDWQVVE